MDNMQGGIPNDEPLSLALKTDDINDVLYPGTVVFARSKVNFAPADINVIILWFNQMKTTIQYSRLIP